MENEFVTYEQALALKELGFDKSCFGVYSEHDKTRVYDESAIREELKIQAPLYQQAFRWFREKHDKLCSIEFVEPEYRGKYGYKLYYKLGHQYIDHWSKGFKTYEDVQNACLNELIELVKQK